jgi:hypothetical protein
MLSDHLEPILRRRIHGLHQRSVHAIRQSLSIFFRFAFA